MNDTTVLRFDYGLRETEVRADVVADIAHQLQQVFMEAVGSLQPATVELYHVLSPRRGSIEFHFRPQINIQVNTSITTPPEAKGRLDRAMAAATVIGAAATVAGVLWTAVYGQNGVVHGALSKAPQSEPNSSAAILPDLQAPPSLPRLVDSCMASRADRVEIHLPSNAPVVIFDVGGRQVRGLIGRNSKGATYAVQGQGGVRSIRLDPQLPIRVQYGDKQYDAFVADVVEGDGAPVRAVVIWASSTAASTGLDVMAKVQQIQADGILPMEPVPAAFEEVSAVFLLSHVADWR